MDTYLLVMMMIGLASLGMAWMPQISKKIKVSYSILYVAFGAVLYIFGDNMPLPDPIRKQEYTVHLTELVVIISLMGSGLKIDRPFTLKNWSVPFRLVSITMLLSISSMAFLCWYFLGFDLPSAVLLGAVLAPTDPVLASDVQVGPPHEKKRDDVRFGLTGEAGLNDGMAFPFTWLAITWAQISTTGEGSFTEWFLVDVLYKMIVGTIAGFLLGRLLAFILFKKSKDFKVLVMHNGFVALAATLFIYGFTELIHAYGFIAVFVGAVTIRNYEIKHEFHTQLHSFTDQIERILVAIVLILFGGSLVSGILEELSLPMILLAVAFVFVVRPLAGYVALAGAGFHSFQRWTISFFGIKGIGSFFYLSFALGKTDFSQSKEVWSLVALTVLISLLIHGSTATHSMDHIEKRFSREAPDDAPDG
ncbi:cation:proton antiporter [Arundinibacter roseus]|nr:cation:proton antiporter [Arundinibacter roseus]